MSEVDRQRLRALQSIAERLQRVIELERAALRVSEGKEDVHWRLGYAQGTLQRSSDELAQLCQMAFDHAAAEDEVA